MKDLMRRNQVCYQSFAMNSKFSVVLISIILTLIQSAQAQANNNNTDTTQTQFWRSWRYTFSYPKKAIENNIQGEVIVSFDIDSTCSVSNVRLVKGIGYGCDEEAIKAVKNVRQVNPENYRCTACVNIFQTFNFVRSED